MPDTAIQKLAKIQSHLTADKSNRVVIATAYRSTVCAPKHAGMFRATEQNLYIQRGKSWDCIDYCAIRFGRMV